MAEPTTAIRIADTPIPPPSAARLHPVRPPLYRRQSRFTEEMAEDHTPVPSLYEHDDETSRSRIHQPRESPMPSPTTATPTLLAHSSSSSSLSNILRGMNGCAHGAACVILIAIMVEFLTQSRGHWYGKIRYAPFPPFPSPVANPPPPLPKRTSHRPPHLPLLRHHPRRHLPHPPAHPLADVGAAPPRALRGVVHCAVLRVRRARPRVSAGVYVLGDAAGSGGAVGLWVSLGAWVGYPPGGMCVVLWGGVADGFSVWSLAHAALRRRRFGRGIRSYYYGLGGDRPGTPPHLLLFPAPRRRRTPAWRNWTTSTTTRRHDDEEGGVQVFTPRVGGMPPPSASLPLRERVERQQQQQQQQRQRLEKRRQPSLHSTASTAYDKGEGGADEKGLVGVGEEKEEGVVGVGAPGRVVVKM